MRFLLPLTLLVATTSAHAQTTQKRVLPNGLTVLARENRAAPVVAVRIYVRTGSIYEQPLLGSGISHLFEHTLFEGTKTRDKVALNDEIQAIGGQSNAYTSYDVTAYHVTTAKPYFGRAVAVLSDMMRNSTFPESEVKVQQGVIHNEMNLGDDDPGRKLSELWNETAFKTHPVKFPIIGYRDRFDALTRTDIVNYYRTHYTPENTVVSIAGDVSAAQIFDAVQKNMGSWPRGRAKTPKLPSEPIQTSARRAEAQMAVNLTQLQMGWRTIPLQHPDLYALDTLSEILGGSNSSRLSTELLQRRNLVTGVSTYSLTPNYNAGVFAVVAQMPPANQAQVENAIRAQIRRLKTQLVPEAELSRAKRQIRASFILGNQDVESQAEQAAYDELSTKDPNYSRLYVSRIQNVTSAQLKTVANKYLRDNGITVAAVVPKKASSTKPRAALSRSESPLPLARTIAVSSTKPAPARPASSTIPKARIVTLPNGVRLIIRSSKAAPTVSVVAMGLGGARLEPASKAGVANLTTELLTRGTHKRSGEQIAGIVDELGGSMNAFSGYNAWGVESQWLASDWKRGLNLVAESVLQPTFPTVELNKTKAQVQSALGAQDDDPMSAASRLLRQLYFRSHPYGRSALGTASTVKTVSRGDVTRYWNQILNPKTTVLAVYGDVDAAQVEKSARFLFGNFQAKAALPKAPGKIGAPPRFTSKIVQKPGLAQAAMWFGFPSIQVKGADRYAIDVLDAAMSGASLPGGRLHARLRDAELVYVVHAYNSPGLDGGMFVIYAASTKANRARAQSIIEGEIAKVRQGGISSAELERAKSMSISANAIENQTNAALAREAATNELYGLGAPDGTRYAERIQAVTSADVTRVAQKYLDLNRAALAVVEPK